MSVYSGDSDKDVILYEHISDRNEKSYAIGYADPNYYMILMIGVCSKRAITKRIKKGGYNVVAKRTHGVSK